MIDQQQPLEIDRRLAWRKFKTSTGENLYEEVRFNFGLINKFCITVKRGRKKTEFWFNDREEAIRFWESLKKEVEKPTYTIGPDYREGF